MRRFFLALSTLCCISVLWPAYGVTLFSDDFSDTLQTQKNWTSRAPASFTISQSAGVATLKNPDAVYSSFLIHLFAVKPSIFTYSVKLTLTDTAASGAGIMFCLDSKTDLKGYTLQIGKFQYLYITKYTATTAQTIYSQISPFVQDIPGTNVIKISKSGTDFNVFCNGHFIFSFTDSEFSSGDIAVLVQKKSSIKIDDVIVTDQFESAPSSACFADSFLTAESEFAWSLPSAGEASFSSLGELRLNNTDSVFSSSIWGDGISNMASIKAVVSNVSGAGIYGVAFGQITSNRIIPFAFCVNAARKYAIVYPDSPSISSYLGPNILGALGKDTIEVLRFANRFVFKVNGAIQDSMVRVPTNFKINLAGYYAAPKTCLASNYFIAGGDSTGARCTAISSVLNRSILNKTTMPLFGGAGTVYDLMGRKIGTLDRLTFNRLTSGPYIIVTKSRIGGAVRAVRVMKVPK